MQMGQSKVAALRPLFFKASALNAKNERDAIKIAYPEVTDADGKWL
jgi:hypothetical protein